MASAPSDVDLSGGGGEKLWLAKVPRYLIEQWQSQQPGELVGKLDAGTDGAGSSSSAAHFTIKPHDAARWPEGLPAECPLTLDEKLSSEMYVFSKPKPAKDDKTVRPPRARGPCGSAAESHGAPARRCAPMGVVSRGASSGRGRRRRAASAASTAKSSAVGSRRRRSAARSPQSTTPRSSTRYTGRS